MNKVVHFEITYDDEARAKKFYEDVFGWQINKIPNMDYSFAITTEVDEQMKAKEPGAINGGMMKKDPTGEYPVIVIEVDSVDDHVKKIEEAGGQVIMPKMEVPDMGYYARVKDTEGNVIGIWQTIKK